MVLYKNPEVKKIQSFCLEQEERSSYGYLHMLLSISDAVRAAVFPPEKKKKGHVR